MIQHADQLKALDFEGARALHIGDPADETRPLCGRDGEAIIVGTVTETTGRRWCRGCRSQAEAIVLVRTPDPQTGEAIEDLRAPESFRPSAPAPPFKLTKAQRSEILAGEAPRLAFPRPQPEDWPEDKPYPAAPGEIVPVSRSVNFIVTGIRPATWIGIGWPVGEAARWRGTAKVPLCPYRARRCASSRSASRRSPIGRATVAIT